MHCFRIDEQLYGDPTLMEEDFLEPDFEDSTDTKPSRILPNSGKRFRMKCDYDFGDSWQHGVLFEGCVRAKPESRYPV